MVVGKLKPQINKTATVYECPVCKKISLKKDDILNCIDRHRFELFHMKLRVEITKWLADRFDIKLDLLKDIHFNTCSEKLKDDNIAFSLWINGTMKFKETENDIVIRKDLL